MKLRVSLFVFLAFVLGLAACAPNLGQSLAHMGQITPTPTPFLPNFERTQGPDQLVVAVQPLPAQQIRNDVIPERMEDFPAATGWSDIVIPDPVGRFVQPEGQLNILLLGSDQRPDDGGFRTDVILLLTIDPATKQASLTSFPRDLYVYEPGWRVDRINGAFGRGGFDMLADTMEYNFGVRPDYYVLINFWDFQSVVDNLGGINVQAAQSLTDHRDGFGDYTVPAGTVAMDGETALWYVRSRGTSSDFARTRREQEVLQAMFKKLISLNAVTHAAQLYDQYQQSVSTDIGIGVILPLLPLAADLGAGNGEMDRYAVGPDQVTPFTTSAGGAVLLPDYDLILPIMRQALHISS